MDSCKCKQVEWDLSIFVQCDEEMTEVSKTLEEVKSYKDNSLELSVGHLSVSVSFPRQFVFITKNSITLIMDTNEWDIYGYPKRTEGVLQ